jgi:predicted adenine nucleotide alpha hydrolase (AANH) superfamily ATPase
MNPPLVLHICCAPDEAYAVSLIKENYNLYCFFSNSNISTETEYILREKEALRAAEIYGVPFTVDDYDPPSWESAIKNAQHTPEGGERCRQCFLLRLRHTAEFTRQKGLSSFGTVMSVSPHKNVALLNECGKIAAQESGVDYVPFDFKKKDGFRKSVLLSNSLGLYRQNYCGCRLSRDEREVRMAKSGVVG